MEIIDYQNLQRFVSERAFPALHRQQLLFYRSSHRESPDPHRLDMGSKKIIDKIIDGKEESNSWLKKECRQES
jgi:hypothetical protein